MIAISDWARMADYKNATCILTQDMQSTHHIFQRVLRTVVVFFVTVYYMDKVFPSTMAIQLEMIWYTGDVSTNRLTLTVTRRKPWRKEKES